MRQRRAYAFSPAAPKRQVVEVLGGFIGYETIHGEAVRVKVIGLRPVAWVPVRHLTRLSDKQTSSRIHRFLRTGAQPLCAVALTVDGCDLMRPQFDGILRSMLFMRCLDAHTTSSQRSLELPLDSLKV